MGNRMRTWGRARNGLGAGMVTISLYQGILRD